MPNHYLEIAKQQEEEAKVLEKNSKDKSVLMNAFEDVGNSFVNAGYPDNAKENYSKAFNFAKTKKDKERVEDKISKLRTSFSQKKKIVEELENLK